jgi:hypothetical protein
MGTLTIGGEESIVGKKKKERRGKINKSLRENDLI